MDLTYRSPFEGDTDLACHPVDAGLCIWTYQGIAAAMPPMRAFWPVGLRNWYTARRDANLMGLCPLCGSEMPPIMAMPRATVLGEMLHEDDCALVSAVWVDLYASYLAAWVEA